MALKPLQQMSVTTAQPYGVGKDVALKAPAPVETTKPEVSYLTLIRTEEVVGEDFTFLVRTTTVENADVNVFAAESVQSRWIDEEFEETYSVVFTTILRLEGMDGKPIGTDEYEIASLKGEVLGNWVIETYVLFYGEDDDNQEVIGEYVIPREKLPSDEVSKNKALDHLIEYDFSFWNTKENKRLAGEILQNSVPMLVETQLAL